MQEDLWAGTMVDMTWPDIKRFAEQGALVLIPLGVIEEHGPHLCLGTDIYTALLFCRAVRERLQEQGHAALIAPPFFWGVNACTKGFVGSFQIRKETATALLYDILSSLAGFGFRQVFGINAHGDVEHSLAIIAAFEKATQDLRINARYAFDAWRLPHFGYTGQEAFFCPVGQPGCQVGDLEMPDVHAGDVETATMHHYYPALADVQLAGALSPVPLPQDKEEDWLWGGHIHQLSPQGYLGDPSRYDQVDAQAYIQDYAVRISAAIVEGLWT